MNPSYPSGSSQGATRDELRRDESGFNSAWGKGLFLGSILLHLALVGAFYLFQGISQPRILPLVMQMDLASLDLSQDLSASPGNMGGFVGSEAKMPLETKAVESSTREKVVTLPSEPKRVEKPENKVVPVKERVVTKPAQVPQSSPEPQEKNETAASIEPDHKAALKKKTFQADRVLESARSSMEKKVEKQVEPSEPPTGAILGKAFARLEKTVKTQVGSRSGAGSGLKPDSSLAAGVSGNGVRGSKADYTAIDLYNLELMYRIQQNWAFNPRLAGAEKGIEARVLIKILKNGQIRDVWFETRSGNSYLDDSALKAVKKANPLPPLPKGYVTYDIGLRFTPSGLQ